MSCMLTKDFLTSYSRSNYSSMMGSIKEINLKNQTYYFYADVINIKSFDSNLLKIDKKS